MHRQKEGGIDMNWRQLIAEAAEAEISRLWDEMSPEIKAECLAEARGRVKEIVDNLLIGRLKPEFKGERGDKGERGESIVGPEGPQGPQGKSGKDSTIPGPIGPQGPAGRDGAPDTAEQVRDKIQSLKGDARLDKNAIKGLAEELGLIMRTIKAKIIAGKDGKAGGGMGNVQHESFDVSSATTTVTAAYPIGGAGYAIFGMYYNGQQVHRGSHYTVGTNRRTLTLTFTPEDSTKITIVYMRG